MEIVPTKKERDRDLLWLFDVALIIKAINGGLEVFAALLVLLIPPATVQLVIDFVTGGELAQDSNDLVATTLATAAQSFAVHTHYLLALYLALHGLVKVLLVLGIFMKKKIAYPLFMIATTIFGTYEAYRGFILHETLLLVFAAFDIIVFVLAWHDYQKRYPRAALFA